MILHLHLLRSPTRKKKKEILLKHSNFEHEKFIKVERMYVSRQFFHNPEATVIRGIEERGQLTRLKLNG